MVNPRRWAHCRAFELSGSNFDEIGSKEVTSPIGTALASPWVQIRR